VDRLCDVTTPIGPGLRRRQLARLLAELRDAAGVDQATAAAAADVSRPQISNFESSRYVPSKLELPALLALYGASDRLPAMEELRAAANEPGWWSTYGLPSWLQAYVRLESDASRVRYFDLALVPGLLQTEDYAQALLRHHGSTESETKRRLAVLRERQRGVGEWLNLSVVVTEGLLDLTANMGPVGVAQLRDLADAITPGVTEIRVLPTAVGMHGGMSGRFTVLDFPAEAGPPIAYLEHAVGGHLVDDQNVVEALAAEHDGLRAASLDVERSAEVIRAYADRNGQGGQVNEC
jgi:transcriptional regulator with XRE-family HTH domain